MLKYDNLQLDQQLCFSLYSAANSVTRLYRKLLHPYNLTYPQYLVLLVLWQQDGVAIKDVIGQLNMDSGTLSPIIKRLHQAGFIRKERIDEDERIVRLFLTDKAKELEAAAAEVQTVFKNHTHLSNAQFTELLHSLNTLNQQLNTPVK